MTSNNANSNIQSPLAISTSKLKEKMSTLLGTYKSFIRKNGEHVAPSLVVSCGALLGFGTAIVCMHGERSGTECFISRGPKETDKLDLKQKTSASCWIPC